MVSTLVGCLKLCCHNQLTLVVSIESLTFLFEQQAIVVSIMIDG